MTNVEFFNILPARLMPFMQANEPQLMAAVMMGEAEGETDIGKAAVLGVIMNRVRTRHMGCETVHQVALKRHQFSCFWADYELRRQVMLDAILSPPVILARIINQVLDGYDPSCGALYYFNPQVVLPSWAGTMRQTARIGQHMFMAPR